MLVAHIYNPSYLGDRSGRPWFKTSPSKQFVRPYLEKTHHKKGTGGVA
jgi:hypothetical protein